MKKGFIILILLIPLTIYALDVGDMAPDFSAITLDGREFRSSLHKGRRPLYLIFWASW